MRRPIRRLSAIEQRALAVDLRPIRRRRLKPFFGWIQAGQIPLRLCLAFYQRASRLDPKGDPSTVLRLSAADAIRQRRVSKDLLG